MPTPSLRDVKLANYLCGIPSCEDARWKIAFNDRASCHYGVVANFTARQHHHPAAQPNVVADDDGTGSWGMNWVNAVMIRIVYGSEFADQNIIADCNMREGDHDRALIDEDPVTDLEASVAVVGA